MEKDREKFKKEFKARLYRFVLCLIKSIDNLPRDLTCKVISEQLLRSGTSVLANYIEAQSASSKKDFTNFFNHSLKSTNESKVWIAILKDTNKMNKKESEYLLQELLEISNIIASSILTLKSKK